MGLKFPSEKKWTERLWSYDLEYTAPSGGKCTVSVWDDGEIGLSLENASDNCIPADIVDAMIAKRKEIYE